MTFRIPSAYFLAKWASEVMFSMNVMNIKLQCTNILHTDCSVLIACRAQCILH